MSKNEVKLDDAVFNGDLATITTLMKKPDLIRLVGSDNSDLWHTWAEHGKGRGDILDALLSGGAPFDWMMVAEAAITNHSAEGLAALLERLPTSGADRVNSVWSVAAAARPEDQPQAMIDLGLELQRLLDDKRGSNCAKAAAVIRVIETTFPGSSAAALDDPDVLAVRIRTACLGDTKTSPDMGALLTNNVAHTTSDVWANAFHRIMPTHPQGVRIGFGLFMRRDYEHILDRLMSIVGCCPQAQEGWNILWNHRAAHEQKLDTPGLEAQQTPDDIIAWVEAGNWGRGAKRPSGAELEKTLDECVAMAKVLGCPLGQAAHVFSHVLNARHTTQSLMDVLLLEAGNLVPALLEHPNGEAELHASLNRPFIMHYACARIARLPYEKMMTAYPSLRAWRDPYGNSWAHHLAAAHYTGATHIEEALAAFPDMLCMRNNAGNKPSVILTEKLKPTAKTTPSLERLVRVIQMAEDQGVLGDVTAAAGPHEPARAPKM